jgi:peptide deformylase
MIKPINLATDKDGRKQLTTKCVNVDTVLDSPMSTHKYWPQELVDLVTNMKDTATDIGTEQCLGIAANQIWDKDSPCPSVLIMIWPGEEKDTWGWKEFINPVVVTNGKTYRSTEGCLSQPDVVFDVKRKLNATIQFQELDNPELQTIKFYGKQGPWAKICQHEITHIKGKLHK